MHNVTTAKHTFRRAVALASLLSGGCYPFAHREFYPKRKVTAKEGISVLVSDNARCLVPTKDFPKVTVGMVWPCNWHASGPISATSGQRAAGGK